MNEQELRALIRDAVARHLGVTPAGASPLPEATAAAQPPRRQHVSHAIYLTLGSGDDACLIEPAVPCTHCKFCQSHGH